MKQLRTVLSKLGERTGNFYVDMNGNMLVANTRYEKIFDNDFDFDNAYQVTKEQLARLFKLNNFEFNEHDKEGKSISFKEGRKIISLKYECEDTVPVLEFEKVLGELGKQELEIAFNINNSMKKKITNNPVANAVAFKDGYIYLTDSYRLNYHKMENNTFTENVFVSRKALEIFEKLGTEKVKISKFKKNHNGYYKYETDTTTYIEEWDSYNSLEKLSVTTVILGMEEQPNKATFNKTDFVNAIKFVENKRQYCKLLIENNYGSITTLDKLGEQNCEFDIIENKDTNNCNAMYLNCKYLLETVAMFDKKVALELHYGKKNSGVYITHDGTFKSIIMPITESGYYDLDMN